MTTVSVIMSALDEPYVQKTIESVIQNSGSALSEIIIVDDCSKTPITVDDPLVRVVRNDERQGLTRSRETGSRESKGDIIVSLDPHVMVSEDWLTPIIARIESNPKCIAIPATKCLDPVAWKPTGHHGAKSRWRWNLDFSWHFDDGDDYSPMFAGHCFAYSKDWWHDSGGFDTGMDKWGGENIEFSLRSWLAGGTVEIVRNCWVAHWFKKTFIYQMDNRTLLRNKARIAEVWLGEHKRNFYRAVNKMPGSIDSGDVTDRLKLRDRIQTRSIEWYVNQFTPDLFGVHSSENRHFGANFAIVGANPTIDVLGLDNLKRVLQGFDVVIGINYISLHVPCDYVVFHDSAPANAVLESGKYRPEQLVVPVRLKKAKSGLMQADPAIGWMIYELGSHDSAKSLKSKSPPFFHHASTAHTAAHIAAFMGAKSVTMIGCDGTYTGNSHARLPEYNNGNYWPDGEKTQNYLDRTARGYQDLREAFERWHIPLLKIGAL